MFSDLHPWNFTVYFIIIPIFPFFYHKTDTSKFLLFTLVLFGNYDLVWHFWALDLLSTHFQSKFRKKIYKPIKKITPHPKRKLGLFPKIPFQLLRISIKNCFNRIISTNSKLFQNRKIISLHQIIFGIKFSDTFQFK